MHKYRKITQFVYAALVVATIWLFSPAMAGSGDPDIAKQAWPMIEDGVLVLDVRTQEEFDEAHIPGAIHIPWEDTDSIIEAIGSDQQRQVVVYCRTGNRSGKVQTALEQAGYTNIFNATGFEALQSTRP
jgi:phage shock protein E